MQSKRHLQMKADTAQLHLVTVVDRLLVQPNLDAGSGDIQVAGQRDGVLERGLGERGTTWRPGSLARRSGLAAWHASHLHHSDHQITQSPNQSQECKSVPGKLFVVTSTRPGCQASKLPRSSVWHKQELVTPACCRSIR